MYINSVLDTSNTVEVDARYNLTGEIPCNMDLPSWHLQYLHDQLKAYDIFNVDVYYNKYQLFIGFESKAFGVLGYLELDLEKTGGPKANVEVVEISDLDDSALEIDLTETVEVKQYAYGLQTEEIKENPNNKFIRFTTESEFILGLAFMTAGSVIEVTVEDIRLTTNKASFSFINLTNIMQSFDYYVKDSTFTRWEKLNVDALMPIYKAATSNQQIAFKQYIGVDGDKIFTDNSIVTECDTWKVNNKYYFPVNIISFFKGLRAYDTVEVAKEKDIMSLKISNTHFICPIEEGAFQANLLTLIHNKSHFIYVGKLYKPALKDIAILQKFAHKDSEVSAEYTIETTPKGIFIKHQKNITSLMGECNPGCSFTINIDLFKQCLSYFKKAEPKIYLLIDKDIPCIMFEEAQTIIMPALATSANEKLINAMKIKNSPTIFNKPAISSLSKTNGEEGELALLKNAPLEEDIEAEDAPEIAALEYQVGNSDVQVGDL